MVRLAMRVRPIVVVIENVPPLLEDDNHRPQVDALLAQLQAVGYHISSGVHGLWNHDVPQMRRRALIMATLCSEWDDPLPRVRLDRSERPTTTIMPRDDQRPLLPWDLLHEEGLWEGEVPAELRIDPATMRSRARLPGKTTTGFVVAGRVSNTLLTTCLLNGLTSTRVSLTKVMTQFEKRRLLAKRNLV